MKILIGEISSYKAIIICRFIKTNYPDVELLTYDFKPFTKIIRTRYSDAHFVVSESNKVKELAEIINSRSVNLFIPVMSSDIELFLANRALFGSALNWLGSLEAYKTLHYKNSLSNLAELLKIRVPKRYGSIKEAQIPFIVKPVKAASAFGVCYVLNEKDLQRLNRIEEPDKFIIQEYIKGFGAGYSVFSQNGNIITGYGHKRLAEYPITGGSSVYREHYEHDEMIKTAKEILSAVNWTGFCMFEFKVNVNGEVFLIEVNPRIWGSINQGLINGSNYFKPLLGAGLSQSNIGKSYNTYLSPLIYLALLKYFLKGEISIVMEFLTDLNKKADVSIYTDFKGYLNLIVKKIFNIF